MCIWAVYEIYLLEHLLPVFHSKNTEWVFEGDIEKKNILSTVVFQVIMACGLACDSQHFAGTYHHLLEGGDTSLQNQHYITEDY